MKILILILFFIVDKSLGIHPVLLVPGDGGSQLTAQFLKSPPHYICGRQEKLFLLWLNIYFMLPVTLDCFVETIRLEYNVTSRKTYSPDFCDVYAEGLGTVDTISYLSNLRVKQTSYYYYVINELILYHNYEPGKSLRGAPFDFRKSLNELNFLEDLKGLIEVMYKENDNQSVILIGHSLGTLYLNLLLNTMTQEWKDVYVKTFISISGPYLGAVDALRTALSGNNENIPTVNPLKVKPALSSWPSTYLLMPSSKLWPGYTIVATNTGFYTSSEIKELLKTSKIPNALDHYDNNSPIQNGLRAPNTSVYCIYSTGVLTPKFLDYSDGDFSHDQPNIVYGDGDGTVNLESLLECSKWIKFQSKPVITHTVPGVSHLQILRDNRLLNILNDIIKQINDE